MKKRDHSKEGILWVLQESESGETVVELCCDREIRCAANFKLRDPGE